MALRRELHSADPHPLLERARDLARFAQVQRRSHPDLVIELSHLSEAEFAWRKYRAAGGPDITPWQAFCAGLAAQAEWLEQ